jgi:hypothetical protein
MIRLADGSRTAVPPGAVAELAAVVRAVGVLSAENARAVIGETMRRLPRVAAVGVAREASHNTRHGQLGGRGLVSKVTRWVAEAVVARAERGGDLTAPVDGPEPDGAAARRAAGARSRRR